MTMEEFFRQPILRKPKKDRFLIQWALTCTAIAAFTAAFMVWIDFWP